MKPKILPFCLLVLVLVLGQGPGVQAQAPGNQAPGNQVPGTSDWTAPANLSHSGATQNPHLLVDSQGVAHVFWEDALAGAYHAQGGEAGWSAPEPAFVAFSGAHTRLLPDSKGRVHAVWLDAQGGLYYSKSDLANMARQGGWDYAKWLAGPVAAFDAALDAQGVLHVAYVRTQEAGNLPAAVYYLSAGGSGMGWRPAQVLYPSPYLRNLEPGQASIQIEAVTGADQTQVYAAWEVRSRKQVLLAASSDGGATWGEPQEIESPDPERSTAVPFQVELGASAGTLLVSWQSGVPESDCQPVYRWSSDQGQTWSERLSLPESLQGCWQTSQLLPLGENEFLLLAALNGQTFWSRWSGRDWSPAERQDLLAGFEDPETYSRVDFRWSQAVVDAQSRLYVLGTDGGPGGDTWITSRPLGSSPAGAASAVWSAPHPVTSSAWGIASPVLLVTGPDQAAAFWAQARPDSLSGSPQAIFLSTWDGQDWSEANPILAAEDQSYANPAVALDPTGVIWMAAQSLESGQIWVTSAPVERAYSALEWSAPQALPQALPLPPGGAAWPSLLAGAQGQVFAAYTRPVNEGRGVYLTRSADRGETWSEPALVFDGAAGGWEMAGPAQLVQDQAGELHLVVQRQALFSCEAATGLGYTHSSDGGATWAPIELFASGAIHWSRLLSDGATVYRVWEEANRGGSVVKTQYAQAGQPGWSHPFGMANYGIQPGPAALTLDAAGRLHLLQISASLDHGIRLQHWLWDRERWSEQAAQELAGQKLERYPSLAAAVTSSSQLLALYGAPGKDPEQGEEQQQLNATVRTLAVPGAAVKPPLSLTPAPGEPTPSPAPAQSTASPTPTADLSPAALMQATPPAGFSPFGNNKWSGLILGSVCSALVLGASLAMMLVRRRGS